MGNCSPQIERFQNGYRACCNARDKESADESSPRVVSLLYLGEVGTLDSTPGSQSTSSLLCPERKHAPWHGDDLSTVLSSRLKELEEEAQTPRSARADRPGSSAWQSQSLKEELPSDDVKEETPPSEIKDRRYHPQVEMRSPRTIGTAIASKLKDYQAACDALSPPTSPPLESRRLVQKRSGKCAWPTRKLANIRAQRVLKVGIVKFHEELSAKSGVDVEDLPKKDDGTPKLLGNRMLSRLLSGQVELKACSESDAASAQSDLRHLRTEQLTLIRSKTLDFATESATHNARNSFLETVDKHLFEKLTRQCLQSVKISLPANPEVLHSLGLRLVLVRGVVEMLSDGWGKADVGNFAELPPVPNCWALWLEETDWPERCRVALFHVRELILQPVRGERDDIIAASGGEPVAIFRDTSVGIGRECMLHWEIAAVDPKAADVLEEMEKFESKANSSRVIAMELSEVLAKRRERE